MSRRLRCLLMVVASLSAAGVFSAAQAQESYNEPGQDITIAPPKSYATPPVISLVDGSARLVRQGQTQAAAVNMPLIEGDRLVTDDGRAAVRFPDGSWLHLDRQTSVDFLSLSLMRLLDGRVIFGAAGRGGERPTVNYQIDAAAGSVQIQAVGEFHVATYSDGGTPEVELAVVRGTATLMNERGNSEVNAGQRSWAREGTSPEYAQAFNAARLDDFERWSEGQLDQSVGVVSSQYLPAELASYSSSFDQYGRWADVTPYGRVWYPRVAADWRPYYDGYWDYVGPYGWTWIGSDPWCWPTHHWGRWGFNAGVWFWIPGVHWGPAWVSWGYSSGYYGWCPLNYYNRPVAYWHHGGYDHRHAWTVVPHNSFGPGMRVDGHAVRGQGYNAVDRSGFAIGRSTPGAPRAVPRYAGGKSGTAGPGTSRGAAVPRPLAASTPSAYARSRTSGSAFPVPRANGSVAPGASRGQSRYVPGYGAGRPSTAGVGGAVPRGYDRPSASVPGYSQGGVLRPPSTSTPGAASSRGYGRPLPSAPAGSPSRQPAWGAPGYDHPSVSTPGAAAPRGPDRPSVTSPGSSASPRGYDRPLPGAPAGSPSRQPAWGAPSYSRPPSASTPGAAVPRGYDRPSTSYRPPSSAPGAQVYRGVPRSYSTPDYSPRYSAPSAPNYSPRYSAPAPYSAVPRYSAPPPTAPRSYGPPPQGAPRSYSPPSGGGFRGPGPSGSGGAAAPRGGGGPAPSAPSGGQRAQPRGGRGR
jgi:hypothetical protein